MPVDPALLAKAEEIRDETQVGANTAARVGGLFVDLVNKFGLTDDDIKAISDYLEDYNAVLSNNDDDIIVPNKAYAINLHQSRLVLLDSMGLTYDGEPYTIQDGDVYYDSGYIKVKSGGSAPGAVVKKGVLYINKITGKFYEWNGATFVEIAVSGSGGGADFDTLKAKIQQVEDNVERLFNNLANMAFWDAAAKLSATPIPLDWAVPKKTVTLALTLSNAVVKHNGVAKSNNDKIQVDEGSGLTLTVEPASGYALTGAPTVSTGATVTDNGNGTYSVSIASVDADMTLSISATGAAARSVNLNLTGCTKTSGPTSIINGGGGTFVFAANEGYTLPTAAPTVNNATMTSWDSSTGTLVISNVTTGDVTITVTAIEQLTDGFYIFLGKSIDQNGVPVTDAESCYTDFIELDQLSSAYSIMWAFQRVADMSEDGAHLKEKRNLVFYDKNKRMMFMDSKWDAKRHPYSFTQNSNNIRELTIAQVSGILSVAGQNTPVYARISFGMANNTIENACGFTQNGRNYADKTKAHVANFSEAVHDLTFNLTNCTTTATGNQDKVLSGQPVELLFSPSGSGSLNNFSVSATMGGVAVSQSNISIGNYTDADGNSNYKKIVIENITGDLVITASM